MTPRWRRLARVSISTRKLRCRATLRTARRGFASCQPGRPRTLGGLPSALDTATALMHELPGGGQRAAEAPGAASPGLVPNPDELLPEGNLVSLHDCLLR